MIPCYTKSTYGNRGGIINSSVKESTAKDEDKQNSIGVDFKFAATYRVINHQKQ